MKYNFKGSYKLAFTLLLIVLLFVGLIKNMFISKDNDMSYYDNEVYRSIKTNTITEIMNKVSIYHKKSCLNIISI